MGIMKSALLGCLAGSIAIVVMALCDADGLIDIPGWGWAIMITVASLNAIIGEMILLIFLWKDYDIKQ